MVGTQFSFVWFIQFYIRFTSTGRRLTILIATPADDDALREQAGT